MSRLLLANSLVSVTFRFCSRNISVFDKRTLLVLGHEFNRREGAVLIALVTGPSTSRELTEGLMVVVKEQLKKRKTKNAEKCAMNENDIETV